MENREVWWPPRRQARLVLAIAQTVAGACLAGFAFADGTLLQGVLALAIGLGGAFLALEAGRSRVETSPEGVRVVRAFSDTRIGWPDVAEVRPDAQAPWGGRLVVEKRGGEIVKLPVPPMDEVVERWRAAANF
ncbi:PH domain-containing protein [Kribbella sp. NPDC051587]|uniref:PH domain-containing protein n=1 Tax=Kribbella sp. NPDC051587 TaxID=3364119 RepID=UPI00379408B2